jgi:hypothetical protein
MDNKIYFAKYLPVGGGVKEGSVVFWENPSDNGEYSGYYKVHSGSQNTLLYLKNDKYETMPILPEECKEVKLFLCSRDIQVGGTYIDMSKMGRYIPYTENDEFKTMGINPYDVCDSESLRIYLKDKPHCFEVIGEISPEATWVKEGMEFDENEIDIYDVSHLPINVVHIMCPNCKTFH